MSILFEVQLLGSLKPLPLRGSLLAPKLLISKIGAHPLMGFAYVTSKRLCFLESLSAECATVPLGSGLVVADEISALAFSNFLGDR